MSDLPNYDELVAVRLELARVKDQRDALQAGLSKEIRELIRKELSTQVDSIGCHLVERDDLRQENARLKAEVEERWKDISNYVSWGRGLESDLCRAKAELLMVRGVAEDNKRETEATRIENARLKAEVERLEQEVWRMKVFKGIDEDTKATLKDALNTVPEWAKVLETIENNARLETENIRLKAEVERLTKAGDGLFGIAYNAGPGEGRAEKLDAWRKAKGGQP